MGDSLQKYEKEEAYEKSILYQILKMSSKHINSKEELEKLLSILKIEQEEDRLQYKEKVLKSSLSERKRIGVSWYPIVIKESYYSVGERLVLEIERPTNTDVANQFSMGKVASLF